MLNVIRKIGGRPDELLNNAGQCLVEKECVWVFLIRGPNTIVFFSCQEK